MMYLSSFQKLPMRYASERGMVLVIGLVMVLLITIIGISAIRGSGLQESMAGNMRDRNVAFQAAESALREGEAEVSPAVKSLPAFTCTGTSKGLCPDQSKTPASSVIYWSSTQWGTTAKQTTLAFEDVTSPPRYVVEVLEVDIGSSAAAEGSAIDVAGMQSTGDATPYRITAQGFGLSSDTQVVLQSSYKRRY